MTKMQSLNSLLLALTGVSNRLDRAIASNDDPQAIADLSEIEAELIAMATTRAHEALPEMLE